MFWLHDAYHDGGGYAGWRRSPLQATLCILTIVAGSFICVAGMYVSVEGIKQAYDSDSVGSPFSC